MNLSDSEITYNRFAVVLLVVILTAIVLIVIIFVDILIVILTALAANQL